MISTKRKTTNNSTTYKPTTTYLSLGLTQSTSTTKVISDSSFVPEENPNPLIVNVANVERNSEKTKFSDWWLILVASTVSLVMIGSIVLAALVYRNKKKNGVWLKGIDSIQTNLSVVFFYVLEMI